MPDISDLLVSDSPYSKAKEFEDFNETVTITEVGTDQYQDNPPFVWIKFAELDKPCKLNKTIARGLAANFGNDTDQWVGRIVVVVSVPSQTPDGTPTRSFNISAKKPKIKGKDKVGDDDIPF